MLKRSFSQWLILILILMLSLLSACGGGDDSSELLSGTASEESDEDAEDVIIYTDINLSINIVNNNQIANGEDEIQIDVVARDSNGLAQAEIPIAVLIPDGNVAVANPTQANTDANGFFSTKITSSVAGNFQVAIAVKNSNIPQEEVTVTFVETPGAAVFDEVQLSVNVVNDKLTIGEGAIQINVIARDSNGLAQSGVPIVVLMSASSVAVASPTQNQTDDNGFFTTNISSTVAGNFVVTIAIQGTSTQKQVTITFIARPEEEKQEIANVRMITNNPQLGSEGNTEGVIISAIVTNKNNNLVEGIPVTFSSCLKKEGTNNECDSNPSAGGAGELQSLQVEGSTALAGVTNASGRAQARLTTQINHDNRTILASANALTITSLVPVEVTGTTITVTTDKKNMVIGDSADISIFLRDSANRGINQQHLTVSSTNGNTLNDLQSGATGQTISVKTNASGQANVRLIANIPGRDNQDTITVRKGSAFNQLEVNISDDNFTLSTSRGTEINLNTQQEFVVHWDKVGTPQANITLNISATRGNLSTNIVNTDSAGNASFTISGTNSGPAVITASATGGGPTAQINIEFIATVAARVDLQANPSTIGVNTSNSDIQQSNILAVVRDPANNLVKGKLVNFNLQDITGGRLFPASAETDSFGRASTVYTAGLSSGAADGVKVTATVVGTSVRDEVRLTVAAKSLFVTLGTGNKIVVDGPTRYKFPYTVLVTDAAGVAIKETDVVLKVLPVSFRKGNYDWNGKTWVATEFVKCPNEDTLSVDPGKNFNGILDAGEDSNGNGRLDPGNVATFDVGGIVNTVETDANGFADFFIVYPQDFATWVDVQLSATTAVSGSEGSDLREFQLPVAAADLSNEDASPPGQPSPFGIGNSCNDTE